MRRHPFPLLLVACLLLAGVIACSGDDDVAGPDGDRTVEDEDPVGPRFCDAYLDYLADSSPENLQTVEESAEDPQVSEYARNIESDAQLEVVLAATLDLDDLARGRCQTEWTAGAQGAGNTGAAAQALLDAVVAGDRDGARNVASANAIAVLEPWDPVEPDAEAGTPTLADVGGQSFTLVLGPDRLAQCEVETGVVVACQVTG